MVSFLKTYCIFVLYFKWINTQKRPQHSVSKTLFKSITLVLFEQMTKRVKMIYEQLPEKRVEIPLRTDSAEGPGDLGVVPATWWHPPEHDKRTAGEKFQNNLIRDICTMCLNSNVDRVRERCLEARWLWGIGHFADDTSFYQRTPQLQTRRFFFFFFLQISISNISKQESVLNHTTQKWILIKLLPKKKKKG